MATCIEGARHEDVMVPAEVLVKTQTLEKHQAHVNYKYHNDHFCGLHAIRGVCIGTIIFRKAVLTCLTG